jgi:hypothetical protein
MNLILTLVVLAVVLGIAWWIVSRIPGVGGSWIVQVIFGLVALLVVLGLFTGGFPAFVVVR